MAELSFYCSHGCVKETLIWERPSALGMLDLYDIWSEVQALDLYSKEVDGRLTMARFRRKPAEVMIHHSDRGSQYASGVFQAKLKEYGMVCSMSRKGNC